MKIIYFFAEIFFILQMSIRKGVPVHFLTGTPENIIRCFSLHQEIRFFNVFMTDCQVHLYLSRPAILPSDSAY